MKKLILTTTTFIFIQAGITQDLVNLPATNKVTTVAYWNKGESRTYHVTKTNSEYKNNSDKPSKEEKVEYDLTLTVVDSTEHSYTLETSYSNYIFTGEKSALKKSLSGVTANKKLRYVTNEFGSYDSIINKKEIIELMKKAINQTKPKLIAELKSDKEKKEAEMALAAMEQMMTNENNVEALYSESLLSIHGIYGFEMLLNKPTEVELYYPALENIQMNGTGTYTLKEINKAKKECKIEIIEKPNKEDIKKLTSHIISLLVPAEEKPDLTQFNYNSSIKLIYHMDLSNGWMNKITTTGTTVVTYKKDTLKKVEKNEYQIR